MDSFIALREMWREARQRRALVVVVLVIAILTGLFVAYRPGLPPESRQYRVWLASTDILVDTSTSQVVGASGPDFLTLASRTSLLGNLMATGSLKTAIAAAAGVRADRLVVVPPAPVTTSGVPIPPAPVVSRSLPDAEATILTVSTDATLPILRVTAQAPRASTAGSLAGETIVELERYLDSVAATEEIPAARKLVVRQLGARAPAAETRGPHPLLGFAAAIVVALLGCAAIVAVPMLARRWRQAEAAASASGPIPVDHEAAGAAANHEQTIPAASASGPIPVDHEAAGAAANHEQTVPFDRGAHRNPAHGDEGRGDDEVDEAELERLAERVGAAVAGGEVDEAELERLTELAGAAVAGGRGAITEGSWQPTQRKKQSRRRRKHGRPQR